MGKAKKLVVEVIDAASARAFVKKVHYSGKIVNNSSLHFGVFWEEQLEGVMQFGPPTDKRKMINLVEGTGWNDFLELNRMAFTDKLPRNSESRAIAIACRLIKKNAPHIKWILSFSDGTQCGDGTIYRASGFLLTQIRKNLSILRMPGGETIAQLSITSQAPTADNHIGRLSKKYNIPTSGSASVKTWRAAGAEFIPGFQLRYIKLLYPGLKLTCEVLPFETIEEKGAGMYKGVPK